MPGMQALSDREKALLMGFAQCLGTARDVEFLIDIGQMEIDGTLTDKEACRYFFITQSAREQPQHLEFARGQTFKHTASAPLFAETRDEASGDLRLHQYFPTSNHPHSLREFVRGNVFEDVAARTSAQRLIEIFFTIEGGE